MNHPLSDRICYEIETTVSAPFSQTQAYIRAAADWQLEQVIRYLENNLEFAIDWSDTFIDRFKEAMRPQEDN